MKNPRKRSRKNVLTSKSWQPDCGATIRPDGTTVFKVWGPRCSDIKLKLFKKKQPESFSMNRNHDGYFSLELNDVPPGTRYSYLLDNNKERPDPASRFQPDGIHRSSCLVHPHRFRWHDQSWKGIPSKDLVFYEIHVGTFTPEGTFEAIIKKIPYLKELGVTCLEMMPVAQFPGTRNWGYDGVGLFAVQNSYGGPDQLKALVNACHIQGIAVCLDVVYNHFGPEGNYLHDFGPYFTQKYHTPWGDAINYDGSESGPVRNFIIDNALYWITEFHVDALRLDAIHGIYDSGATHILKELGCSVQKQARGLGRKVSIIAESDLNDSRIIRPESQGGFGLDAQWSNDFHHSLHVLLTGERNGYYGDYSSLNDLAKSIEKTFIYDGRYSAFRKRKYGNDASDVPGEKFVINIQNHDQIGNRAFGDRISTSLSYSSQKLAAAVLIFSPYLPLVFMGQEYGELAPFQYFISHSDPQLIEKVRKGRNYEFASFGWDSIPDPKSEETFKVSRLNWNLAEKGEHRLLLKLYKDLIALRKSVRRNGGLDKFKTKVKVDADKKCMTLETPLSDRDSVAAVFSFADQDQDFHLPFGKKSFKEILNTEDKKYGGPSETSARKHRGKIRLKARIGVIGQIGS